MFRHAALAAVCAAVVACSPASTDSAGPPSPLAADTASPAASGSAEPSPSPTPTGPTPPSDVSPFTDPNELAEALATAETTLASPETSDEAVRAWAWLQQQAYRDLVVNLDWRPTAKAALPPEFHTAFDLNIHAGTQLRKLTKPREALPDWRIIPAPPVDELRAHYDAAAAEFGVDWSYLAAIHFVESRMGRIRGTSTAGARGPMQFMPATWEAYGEGDIDDPRDAIRAAARYLVAHGAPGNMRRALYAYNHSQLYVDAIEDHARVMREYPHYYRTYYNWRVYYITVNGDILLEEGYGVPS
ncbi:MAG: transglycosylase SLT domain-containing protein [Actinomycetota bacterium]|nr:transglycosylase SLT domain-containing protein [Actinomycetota bacterium]